MKKNQIKSSKKAQKIPFKTKTHQNYVKASQKPQQQHQKSTKIYAEPHRRMRRNFIQKKRFYVSVEMVRHAQQQKII